jgi:hypothetical protein
MITQEAAKGTKLQNKLVTQSGGGLPDAAKTISANFKPFRQVG